MKVRRRKIQPLIRNPVDGTFYRPSCPDSWTEGDALASALTGEVNFYFREVVRIRRRWLADYWLDTGMIWQPESGSFEVLSSPAEIEKALEP